MQRGRGGRDPFFDFGGPFGNFGSPFGGGFGSFGPPGSLMSNFFGGANPFDDPFFTRPFGGMFESSMMLGPPRDLFPDMHPSGYIEHQAPESRNSRGPIIEELDSDGDEKEFSEQGKEKRARNSRSNNEPHVMHPDYEIEGNRRHQLQPRNDFNRFSEIGSQPQAHSFCFQSSTVSYGGPDGAYYTSSRTRRSGSDGVTFEESKEADSARREATHRVSRGLHNKGHSLTRKLNSDGKVDSMQMLHNLNEDELSGFEEAWQGKAQKYLPGWAGNAGASGSRQIGQGSQGGLALPSTEDANHMGTMPEFRDQAGSSATKERTRTGKSDRSANHRRARG